ncbi:MAG: nucleotidyltransferase family protein [Proteobacteria bacterium]|nr:nucleotidyltransferase family protein [Pseudomonadota bacterium]
MKAMILSAGRGERMRPLTDMTPKALIPVKGKFLIEYHLEALSKIGVQDIVINLAYMGEEIKDALRDGRKYGVRIRYSEEGDQGLETGGGIYNALPLLGKEPFIVVNCDVYTKYSFDALLKPMKGLVHLVLVDNPEHNQKGDFDLKENLLIHDNSLQQHAYTYAGIGVYHPDLFKGCKHGKFRLLPVLLQAIEQKVATGEYYPGPWIDIGTRERLIEAERGKA